MKKAYILLAAMMAISIPAPVMATGMVAGATEPTQILNNIQLGDQYTKQLDQYMLQGKEYTAQLQNLARNPASMMGTAVNDVIHGVGTIMSAEQSIGGTYAKIDQTFSTQFKNPLAGTFSQNFKTWTTTSQDTLGAAMRAAGAHRDAVDTDTQAIQKLFNKSQSSDGTVAAVQQLSALVTMQIQQTQKLQDLIATQNIASSSYLLGQNAKDKTREATYDKLATPYTTPIPPVGAAKIIDWNAVLLKK